MIHPEHRAGGGALLDKMHPECLNLVSIIRKCKLKIPAIVSGNTVGVGGGDAFSLSFTRRKKIGDSERMPNERIPGARKPSGHIWKHVAVQDARKSLEWAPWARYLNLSEFNNQKNSRCKEAFGTEEGGPKSPQQIRRFCSRRIVYPKC